MLGISRASVYYIPRPVSEVDQLMRAMDELHLEYPFAGSRIDAFMRPMASMWAGNARGDADATNGQAVSQAQDHASSPSSVSVPAAGDGCVQVWAMDITIEQKPAPANSSIGTPEIFNTDQGSQFTSLAFTKLLKHHDIRISMDGKRQLAGQRLR